MGVFTVNLGGLGSGSGVGSDLSSRKKHLGLDFGSILKENEKKNSETDRKFEEIINRSGMISINGKVSACFSNDHLWGDILEGGWIIMLISGTCRTDLQD